MTDTSGTAIKAAMADIQTANESRGVTQRGGKRYTMVADRVEVFRRHFGAELCIVTNVLELATELPTGTNVVVRADVRDGEKIIATGHAAEVWGQGNVNRTSALENAETSAIGRALAALGLHGGEFASANELDAVERKGGGEVQLSGDVASTNDVMEMREALKWLGRSEEKFLEYANKRLSLPVDSLDKLPVEHVAKVREMIDSALATEKARRAKDAANG